jgi:hypothetical protein
MSPDLRGIEFDWFASDREGNLALFSTAGEGFFPEEVSSNHVQHTSISEAIPTPNLGMPNVWQDYAVIGLFVFDWVLPGGPYKKVASPQKVANQPLMASVLAIPDLPQFAASFHNTATVKSWS